MWVESPWHDGAGGERKGSRFHFTACLGTGTELTHIALQAAYSPWH
jgi:hypothetical protein